MASFIVRRAPGHPIRSASSVRKDLGILYAVHQHQGEIGISDVFINIMRVARPVAVTREGFGDELLPGQSEEDV